MTLRTLCSALSVLKYDFLDALIERLFETPEKDLKALKALLQTKITLHGQLV